MNMHYSNSSGPNGKRKDAPRQSYDVRQAKQQRLYQQLSVQPETNGRSLLHSTHGVFDRQVDILFEAWTEGIPRQLPRKHKYYVVWRGHRCGIFLSWAECEPHVYRYPGAGHKSVDTFDEIVSNYSYETNKMNTDTRSKRDLLNHGLTKGIIAERLEEIKEQAHPQTFDDDLDVVDDLEELEDDGTEASGSCAPTEFPPRPTAATAGMLGSGVSSNRSSGSRESWSSSSSVLSSPARSHSIFSSSPPTSSYSGVMLPSETKIEGSLEGQEDHVDFTTADITGVDLDFSDVAKSLPTRVGGRPHQKGRMNLHGLKQTTLSSVMGKNGRVVNQSIEGENCMGVKFAAAESSKAMEAVGHARDAKGKGVMSREEDFMAQIRELTEQNEGLKNLVGQMVDQK